MTRLNQDTISGVGLLVLAALTSWMSLGMGKGAGAQTLPPSFMPLVCAAALGVCGIVLFARGLAEAGICPKILDARVGAVLAVLVPALWFFDHLDVRVIIWGVALVSLVAFGIRSWKALIIFPLLLSAVLFVAFARGFNVVLPTWI